MAVALIAMVGSLNGCSFFTRLSTNDIARCDLVFALPPAVATQDDVDLWNKAFLDLSKSDNNELAGIGAAFNKADLRNIDQASPYRQQALKYCDKHGWNPPSGSGPASPSPSGQPA